MNALPMIKSQAPAAKPAAEPAKTAADDQGFGKALQQEVQGNNKAETNRDQQIKDSKNSNIEKSAQTEEAAVTASEDGKNLPHADKAVKTANTENNASADDEVESPTVETTDEKVQADDAGETEAENAPAEKPVVAVAAPAIKNAATEKVTMTLSDNAKAQPKPVSVDGQLSSKNQLQNLTPLLNAEGDIEIVDGKTRFADILKKDSMAQTAIRADILQAISQKTSSDESDGQTLKTSLQNLLTGADNKPLNNAQAAELIRQIQPGQQRSSDNRAPAGLMTALTPAANTPGQASAGSAPQIALDVQPQLNSAAWSRVVSSRVVWMAREGVQQAELRLNPSNLGPVEVRLNINNDQASVTFLAQNAATRDALEQAMPRLRESLAENGLSLSHSEVSQQDHSDQPASENETSMQNGHLAQVSVQLDDTEDELVAAAVTSDGQDNRNGISLYA